MNWYQRLEYRRSHILFALMLIAITTIVVTSMRTLVSYDTWWQLAMGTDWIQNGLSPRVDHYSFTFLGETVDGAPKFFQALLHLAVSNLGTFWGLFAMKAAAFVGTFALFLLWLRLVKAPVIAYCLSIPLLVFLFQLRAIVRPELFTYVFIAISMLLYLRASGQVNWRTILPIALLMVAWRNYHSYIFAYVIFSGLFVDSGLHLLQQRAGPKAWGSWFLWGLLLLLIGADLQGGHVLISMFTFPDYWKEHIVEYESSGTYANLPAAYVLAVLTALTIPLLVHQRKFGYLLVTLAIAYYALTMSRIVTPGGIILLCIITHALVDTQPREWLSRISPRAQALAGISILILFLVPLWNSVSIAREFIEENKRSVLLYPENMMEYVESGEPMERVFNAYELGGYLIHRLRGQTAVYIDGRSGILYPVDHYQKLLDASTFPEVFLTEVEKYDIDAAILQSNARVATLMYDAGFVLDYPDLFYALYRKGAGKFESLGRLWASPACWGPEFADAVRDEWVLGMLDLPPGLLVQPLASIALQYQETENEVVFLEELSGVADLTDASLRFLGFRAIENGLHNLAVSYFDRVEGLTVTDHLGKALAYIESGSQDAARSEIALTDGRYWTYMRPQDQIIKASLLVQLGMALDSLDAKSSLIDEEFRGEFGIHLEMGDSAVSTEVFCGH